MTNSHSAPPHGPVTAPGNPSESPSPERIAEPDVPALPESPVVPVAPFVYESIESEQFWKLASDWATAQPYAFHHFPAHIDAHALAQIERATEHYQDVNNELNVLLTAEIMKVRATEGLRGEVAKWRDEVEAHRRNALEDYRVICELRAQLAAPAPSSEIVAVPLQVCMNAVIALAHASKGASMYGDAYEGLSNVVEQYRKGETGAPAPSSEAGLRAALQIVADWRFPETGKTWDDGTPTSYATEFGSHGERDYMKKIAADALATPSEPSSEAAPGCTHPVGCTACSWCGFKATPSASTSPASVASGEVSAAEAILLAGIQSLCISADQEWCRQDGALSDFDKGWFTGQLHAFDLYTPVEKNAVAEARAYIEKLTVSSAKQEGPSFAGMPAEDGEMKAAAYELGKWLSAALDDQKACDEFKAAINEWFNTGMPVAPKAQSEIPPTLTIGEAMKAVGAYWTGTDNACPTFGSPEALRVYTMKMQLNAALRSATATPAKTASVASEGLSDILTWQERAQAEFKNLDFQYISDEAKFAMAREEIADLRKRLAAAGRDAAPYQQTESDKAFWIEAVAKSPKEMAAAPSAKAAELELFAEKLAREMREGTAVFVSPAASAAPSADPSEREYIAASNLAKAIHAQHYREDSPHWRALPDLLGVISQIDNMTAGMRRATIPAADAAKPSVQQVIEDIKRRKGNFEFSEAELIEFIGEIRSLPAADADAVRVAAYEHAAHTIELFDDKTMEGDYMLDAGECAGIIRALKSDTIRAALAQQVAK